MATLPCCARLPRLQPVHQYPPALPCRHYTALLPYHHHTRVPRHYHPTTPACCTLGCLPRVSTAINASVANTQLRPRTARVTTVDAMQHLAFAVPAPYLSERMVLYPSPTLPLPTLPLHMPFFAERLCGRAPRRWFVTVAGDRSLRVRWPNCATCDRYPYFASSATVHLLLPAVCCCLPSITDRLNGFRHRGAIRTHATCLHLPAPPAYAPWCWQTGLDNGPWNADGPFCTLCLFPRHVPHLPRHAYCVARFTPFAVAERGDAAPAEDARRRVNPRPAHLGSTVLPTYPPPSPERRYLLLQHRA